MIKSQILVHLIVMATFYVIWYGVVIIKMENKLIISWQPKHILITNASKSANNMACGIDDDTVSLIELFELYVHLA